MESNFVREIINKRLFFISSDTYKTQKSFFAGYAITDNGIYLNTNPAEIIFDPYTAGIFQNVICNSKHILIQQDYYCGSGIYIFRNDKFWAISNSLLYLVLNLRDDFSLTINFEYLALYLCQQVCINSFTETIIKEIKEIPNGTYLSVDRDTGILHENKHEYKNYQISLDDPGIASFLDKWKEKYERIYASLAATGFNIAADLSGGFDTRCALATYLNLLNKNVSVVSSRNPCLSEDFDIASQIARILNFSLNDAQAGECLYISEKNSLACALYAKLCMHSQFYYPAAYNIKPSFRIAGGGGEAVRGYQGFEISADEIVKRYSTLSHPLLAPFNDRNKIFLQRLINTLENNYHEQMLAGQKIYLYTRIKNHYMRSAIESAFCNQYVINPLLDPELRKLDVAKKSCDERLKFCALIYNRYLPELHEIPFEGGRTINNSINDSCRKINNEFPYRPKEISEYFTIYNKDFNIDRAKFCVQPPATKQYMLEIFESLDVKKFIAATIGFDSYRYALEYKQTRNYFGEEQINKINSYYILGKILEHDIIFPNIMPSYFRTNCVEALLHDMATARIDIKNYGDAANTVAYLDSNDSQINIMFPAWFATAHGKGMVLETRQNELILTLNVVKNGTVAFIFRAPDRRTFQNERINYAIDYMNISIYSHKMRKFLFNFSNIFRISHDKTFTCKSFFNDGDTIEIKIRFKAHDYKLGELSKLILGHYSQYEL